MYLRYDDKAEEVVPQVMAKAAEKNVTITLPVDFVCGDKFDAAAAVENKTQVDGIPEVSTKIEVLLNQCKVLE